MSFSTPLSTYRHTVALMALGFMLLTTACSFDPVPVDERRCLNDSACIESFGEGWECVNEYCQQQVCISDQECDNGIFCDGPEKCVPDSPSANIKGCVPGENNIAELAIDDEVECTNDFCDEERRRVVHDATGCECTGADDQSCALLNNTPCVSSVCDTSTFTCVSTPLGVGEDCSNPDVLCVGQDGRCDANGACVPKNQPGADGFCQTTADAGGFFCNGAETCDPLNPAADPQTGCVPGVAPAPPEGAPACVQMLCFERGIEDGVPTGTFQPFPTETCECAVNEDCPQDDCKNWVCNQDTFVCELSDSGENDPLGTSCNDGIACTTRDACDDNGNCVGEAPSDFYCAEFGCESGVGTCDPNNGDPESGCQCAPAN